MKCYRNEQVASQIISLVTFNSILYYYIWIMQLYFQNTRGFKSWKVHSFIFKVKFREVIKQVIKQWHNNNKRNRHISNLKCILTVHLYLTDTLFKHLNVKGLESNHFWWICCWSWSIGYVAWFLTFNTAFAGTKYFAVYILTFQACYWDSTTCVCWCVLYV